MQAIELKNLTKTFNGFTAVNNLSLDVPKGSIYGFIGPNGSGKTTTIRMIMNILYPDSGTINILGNEKKGSTIQGVGYLPEERGLYKKMKVRDILTFYGQLKKAKNLNQNIEYWLNKFELKSWEDKKVEALSKGMSQKIQFICTVIDNPDVIILDEPFSGLDPVNAELLKNTILELQQKGSTIIFSTHDMAVAEKMCDYIFMIFKGQKVLNGTLVDIQNKFGTDTIRVQATEGKDKLNTVKGIEKVNDFGQIQELKILPGTDPHEIIKEILNVSKLTKFELAHPSLHDIFIRIAGPEATELN